MEQNNCPYVIFRIRLDPEKKISEPSNLSKTFFQKSKLSRDCDNSSVPFRCLEDQCLFQVLVIMCLSASITEGNMSNTWEPFHFILIQGESWYISITGLCQRCHYKGKSYFNNIKCSFKSFLSNLGNVHIKLG